MSGIRTIKRYSSIVGVATPTSAPVYVDSDDDRLKLIPGGTGTTEVIIQEAKNRTLTPIVAFTLTAEQSGMEIFLGPTAGFQITLPAVAAGLRYRFTVAANFITSDYTIINPGAANLINGGATVAGADVPAEDEDTISFVASAELEGDFVDVWSNGTLWFVNGRGTTSGSITFTT